MEIVSQMLWPLLACFILVGIHAYLGIHVIARKVIFVDLALAQIAGLGAVYGVFIGLSFESDPWAIKGISVGFTLLGASLFAVTRTNNESIPHEAIIGIIYASALSLMVLLTSNLPHGAEEVQQMLAGSILWVTPAEVLQTAILYGLIGLVHVIFRRQFFALSNDIALKSPLTLSTKLWDFLFYATFGVVVTSSVGMGGVLLVFGYLVIPSVIGVMLAESLRSRLIIGWASGVLMSILGIIISYYGDLPSGPCIVVLLALLLIVMGVGLRLCDNKLRAAMLTQLIMLGGLMLAIIYAPALVRPYLESDHEQQHARRHRLEHHEDAATRQNRVKNMLLSPNKNEVLEGLNIIKTSEGDFLKPELLLLLSHSDAQVRESTAQIIAQKDWRDSVGPLKDAFSNEPDEFIRIEIAESILSLRDPAGFFLLATIWQDSKSELAQEDALMHVQSWIDDAPSNGSLLLKWLKANGQKLEFDEKTGKYIIK